MGEHWAESHRAHSNTVAELHRLDQEAVERTLSAEEERQRLLYGIEIRGPESMLPALRARIEANPEDADLQYLLGQTLAQQD